MEEYINERLKPQIEWYDQKAIHSQKWYKLLHRAEIFIAGVFPLICFFASAEHIKVVTIVTSVLLALIVGFQNCGQYQTLWVRYRRTAEALTSEMYLAKNRCGDYANADKELLVERAEGIIKKENALWEIYSSQKAHNNYVSTGS